MKHYLYVKTITDSMKKVNPEKLNSIVTRMDSDKITVTQRFIGCGNACYAFSEDQDELAKMRDILEKLEISSYIISEGDIAVKQQRFFVPAEVIQHENEIVFKNSKGSIRIEKDDTIIFGAGLNKQRIEKPMLKSYLLNDKSMFFIYSAKKNVIMLMDYASVNFSGLKDASKYSRTENIQKLMNALKGMAFEFYEDYYYSKNYIPDLMPDLPEYTAIIALLSDKGYYRFTYDAEFFSENEQEEGGLYDYKYNIYRPGQHFMKHDLVSELNLGVTLLVPVVVAGIFIFFSKDARWLSGAGIMFISAVLIFFFIKYLKLRMYIEDIPDAKLESLSIGLHEVKGNVLDRNAIPSPISGVKSVFFRYYKFRYETGGDKKEWKLKEIGEYVPECFYIEQDGHTLRVNTAKAVFDVTTKAHINTPFYLMNSEYKTKDEKYVEICLPVYKDVYIMGTVTAKDNRNEFTQFLRDRKSDPEFMKKFDKDGNNEIDADEWEEARTEIEHMFTEKISGRKQNELLQIGYSKDDNIFYISEKSEKTILRTLKFYLIANMTLIIAMIVGGAWLIWG